MRALPLVLLLGCSENDLSSFAADNLAVVTGDFDDVAEPLDRLAVPYRLFDGVTAVATWDPDYVSETHAQTVEGLLGDATELHRYQVVLIASGTRGLGDVVYNGVAPDDALVADPIVQEAVRGYVESGGTLFVSDWGYDLIEAVWPGMLDPVGDDEVLDAAQTGLIGTVVAKVREDRLAAEVGDTVAVAYDFSNWAPVRAVAGDVTVWLVGDVTFRESGSDEVQTLTGSPLLVSFRAGAGQVVYASFHVSAQTDAVADAIYRLALGPLPEGRDTGAP